MVDIHLSKKELELLKTVLIVEQDLVDKIGRATLEGDKYTIEFSYDELDELAGIEALLEDYEKEVQIE